MQKGDYHCLTFRCVSRWSSIHIADYRRAPRHGRRLCHRFAGQGGLRDAAVPEESGPGPTLAVAGNYRLSFVHHVNGHRATLQSWFAVLTKPRAEAEAQMCLTRQGFETLFARTRRSVRAATGMVVRTESLFPRYIFLHSDPSLQSLEPVRSTRGVSTIVRFGGHPAVVPDIVIEQIRLRIDPADGFVRLAPPELQLGAKVRINEGPFSGMDAIFAANHGEDRVRLLLSLLGNEREVVVPKHALGARI